MIFEVDNNEISEHNVFPDLRAANLRSNDPWDERARDNPYYNTVVSDWTLRSVMNVSEPIFA